MQIVEPVHSVLTVLGTHGQGTRRQATKHADGIDDWKIKLLPSQTVALHKGIITRGLKKYKCNGVR